MKTMPRAFSMFQRKINTVIRSFFHLAQVNQDEPASSSLASYATPMK
jgi:hypothetical protein